MDRRAAVRRTGTVTFQDPDLAPLLLSDDLAPIGTEITAYRTLGDDVTALGVFGVDATGVTDDGTQLATTVNLFDRSRAVSEARLVTARVFPAGTLVTSAIVDLVSAAVGAIDLVIAPDQTTLPLTVLDAQSDPWVEATRLAESIGAEVFFDDAGRLSILPEPTLNGQPSVTVTDGDGGSLTSFGLNWSRDGVYNAVIATGANSDDSSAPYAIARDLDSESPTFWDGPFGRKPRFYSSELLTSDDQARVAAQAILQRSLGVPRSVRFDAVPDPSIRPSSIIRLRRSARGIDETHIVETITVPLTATETQTGTTRTQFIA